MMPDITIDTSFDFRSDAKGDPDSTSKKLQSTHRFLWSKPLPNGEFMSLEKYYNALKWKDIVLSSDSIIVSFRYGSNHAFIENVKASMPDYDGFIENYLHRASMISGFTLFPKFPGGMNQSRGCNKKICDRWDLTLECIRRWYAGEESPLSAAIEKNREFFELFVDFKGYVDFFFFQDCVSEDYGKVILWYNTPLFINSPIPKTNEDYMRWIELELDFAEKRKCRIEEYLKTL
ncbi:MAG: hypothetical protein MJZ60_08850 [Bacteroidaceae bacterium]|nr:hypothetical protein [Bacteroidaceae bacterium]